MEKPGYADVQTKYAYILRISQDRIIVGLGPYFARIHLSFNPLESFRYL